MTNQQEIIDQYHSGQMSSEEMIDFENQMASNPELKADSNFQSEVISGIKEFRKTELKARLNSIEVGYTWMEFAMQSTLVKSFGGVALATLIGSAVYLFADKKEIKVKNGEPLVVSMPALEEKQYGIEIEDFNTIQARSKTFEHSAETATVLPSSNPENSESQESSDDPVALDSKKSEKQEPSGFTHEFSAPNVSIVEEEAAFESVNLDELPEAKVGVEKKIDVITENVRSIKIQYKYYDGKLFLSGDFDKSPYEILEINSSNGRRIFIKYLDTYYQVKSTDKLSVLPEVTDQKLIKELQLLKENK